MFISLEEATRKERGCTSGDNADPSVVTIRALRILSQNARSTGARRPNIRIQKTAVLPAHKSTSKFNRFSLSLHLSNRTISNKEKRGKFLSPRGTFDLGVALHGFLPNSPPTKKKEKPEAPRALIIRQRLLMCLFNSVCFSHFLQTSRRKTVNICLTHTDLMTASYSINLFIQHRNSVSCSTQPPMTIVQFLLRLPVER